MNNNTSHIEPIPNEIWNNPWFPLKGPPRNEEENNILQKAIEEEQKVIEESFAKKWRDTQEAKFALSQAARSNCVDVEYDWKQCLTSFKMERFLNMCSNLHAKHQQCIVTQSRNLSRLHFTHFYHEEPTKLEEIIVKADKMYLEEQNLC
jgi:hypothetical protein